jgi:glycosyltransferase involved in cell wall biosynthesis
MGGRALRILFASPAWWPAAAFGGPVTAARELTAGLVARGHTVEVVTTSLVDLQRTASAHTRLEEHDGVRVRYLATPLRYRWMGITPTLPIELGRLGRPDVVHVFGFRDPVTTGTATWARLRRIPYVFEPLGMYRPRLRKVALKRALDSTLYKGIATGAAAIVVSSRAERDDVAAGGIPPERIHLRGNGFPKVAAVEPAGRAELGIPEGATVVLYVGRIAAGKGIELLLAAMRELPEPHVVLIGPDDRHGVAVSGERVHVLPPSDGPPLSLYALADVFCLPSSGESFGLAAAEAAAAGTPVVVSDRCGVAELFADGEALVVPYDGRAVTDAIRRVLSDGELRRRLADGGRAAARRNSWERVCERQEELYRLAVASRTATTRLSTDGP